MPLDNINIILTTGETLDREFSDEFLIPLFHCFSRMFLPLPLLLLLRLWLLLLVCVALFKHLVETVKHRLSSSSAV